MWLIGGGIDPARLVILSALPEPNLSLWLSSLPSNGASTFRRSALSLLLKIELDFCLDSTPGRYEELAANGRDWLVLKCRSSPTGPQRKAEENRREWYSEELYTGSCVEEGPHVGSRGRGAGREGGVSTFARCLWYLFSSWMSRISKAFLIVSSSSCRLMGAEGEQGEVEEVCRLIRGGREREGDGG